MNPLNRKRIERAPVDIELLDLSTAATPQQQPKGTPVPLSGRNLSAPVDERRLLRIFEKAMAVLHRAKPTRNESPSEASPRQVLDLFSSLTAHPGFLLDCICINQGTLGTSLRRDALYAAVGAFGASQSMFQRGFDLRGETIALGKATPKSFEAVATYISATRKASAEELLRAASAFGLPVVSHFPPFKNFPVGKLRNDLNASVPEAVRLARVLHACDFVAALNEITVDGIASVGTKSDALLKDVIDMYDGFGKVVSQFARALFSDADLTRGLMGCTMEELASSALASFSERMTLARDKERAIQQSEEFKKAQKLAQSQEERRKAEEAIAQREISRQEDAARERQRSVDAFHARFQATPISVAAEAALEKLQSGDGIPHSRRAQGQRLHAIVECLRSHLFDYRGSERSSEGDPLVQQLAKIVFSPGNIGLAAQAFDIDAVKCLHVVLPEKSPVESVVRAVSDLFRTSPECRKTLLTMLDQADGIVLLATLLLPPSVATMYVRERNWNSHGVNHRGENIRAPLAEKLRRVIEDSIVLKAARASLESPEASAKAPARPAVEIPEWIEEVINRDEFAYSLEDGRILVALKEEPTAALYIPAKCLQDKALFQKEFKLKLDELLSRVELEREISELRTVYGFEVERKNEKESPIVSLWHGPYELEAELKGLPKKWSAAIESLKHRFLEHEKSWEVLLQRAEEQRFSVARKDGGVVLSHALLGDHPLAAGPYIPIRKFDEVASLIERALVAERRESEEASRVRRALERRDKTVRQQVLPLNGEDILVFDANVFFFLAAPRAGGGTWLDLLSATASLNNVRVMIPAIVADFEVLWRVVPFDQQESAPLKDGFKDRLTDRDREIREFFEGASRIKITPDATGYVQGTPGPNRKLCIVESPGDEEFYERAHQLLSQCGGNTRAFWERARAEIFGRDLGDSAITRFLRNCPFNNRITVVTSDVAYSRYSMPRTTGIGAPVSTCTVGMYVASECSLRSRELGARLKMPGATHFHIIAGDIRRHIASLGREEAPLFADGHLGTAARGSGLRPISIEQIIKNGLV